MLTEITCLELLLFSEQVVQLYLAEMPTNIVCCNIVSQLMGQANPYRDHIHSQSDSNTWTTNWAGKSMGQHNLECIGRKACSPIVITILFMQLVVFTQTSGLARQHTLDQGNLWYLLNTEKNQLLGHYSACRWG
jgi:hypothetical protein